MQARFTLPPSKPFKIGAFKMYHIAAQNTDGILLRSDGNESEVEVRMALKSILDTGGNDGERLVIVHVDNVGNFTLPPAPNVGTP